MTKHSFKIDDWTVEPSLNRISRESIQLVLVPKVMKLLLVLANHPNQVLSQDQLLTLVWEGQSVSDSSLYQAIAKLRKALGDDASNPRYIERISGHGYRLIATVSSFNTTTKNIGNLTSQVTAGATKSGAVISHWQSLIPLSGRIFSIGFLILLAGWWYWFSSQTNEAQKSEAHIPEPVIGKNSEPSESLAINAIRTITLIDLQLSDRNLPAAVSALNDILLTRLSHINDLTLVHLRNENLAISTEAVIRGKISSQNDQIRVFLQLEDVAKHEVIWAKYYQGDAADLFSLQDRIVDNLIELFEREKQPKTLFEQPVDSIDFQNYLTARNLWEQKSSQSLLDAKQIFENMNDQGKLFPLAAVGLCDTYQYLHFYSDWALNKVLNHCEPLLSKALKKQPTFGEALAARGLLLSLQRKYILAEESFLSAIKYSPNYPFSYLWFGNMIREQGKYPEALSMIQRAYQLSPMSSQINRSLAYAYLNLRKVSDAQHYYQRSLELDEQFPDRAIADLDFYELNITRAKAFLKWAKENQAILNKRPNYQLTQAQVRLSLGQIEEVKAILAKLDSKSINPSFLLYMQASLASVLGHKEQVVHLLRERLLLHQNNERFILPYVLALFQNDQYQQALIILEKHLPELTQSDIEITMDNQYALVIYLQILEKLNRSEQANQQMQRLTRWFIEQPQRPNMWLASWLNFSGEKAKARTLLTKLLKQGWLPDFNSEVLPVNTMRSLFIDSGEGEKSFNRLLEKNQREVLDL